MTDITDQQGRAPRLAALDTLSAILPAGRCEQLAVLLTDDDVETLRHLAREGMGENTLRALASDFGYLEAWSLAATGDPLPWPAPLSLVLKFVVHHLWDPQEKAKNAEHGMPEAMAEALRTFGVLRTDGPHAPSTVKRRLSSWTTLHRWRGLEGPFAGPELKAALRLAVRAAGRPRRSKSRKAITADILEQMLATCGDRRLIDLRDKAVLLVAFASGGRRRSEIAGLRVDQLIDEGPVPTDPADPESPPLPCLSTRLGRTKTENADDDNTVTLIGRPVEALKAWLEAARITDGPVFRGIDQWGNLKPHGLTGQSINLIVKTRAKKAGLDPDQFSAHGLRAGFLTEAADRGIPLADAMQQSRHKSVAQAAAYYRGAGRGKRRSARLMV